jgi:glycosyltransferase involved in cell wall biosynthesis
VVEAMTCGLPTFATCNGGPSEIIKHGKSGFHIDPYHGDAVRQMGRVYGVAFNLPLDSHVASQPCAYM